MIPPLVRKGAKCSDNKIFKISSTGSLYNCFEYCRSVLNCKFFVWKNDKTCFGYNICNMISNADFDIYKLPQLKAAGNCQWKVDCNEVTKFESQIKDANMTKNYVTLLNQTADFKLVFKTVSLKPFEFDFLKLISWKGVVQNQKCEPAKYSVCDTSDCSSLTNDPKLKV